MNAAVLVSQLARIQHLNALRCVWQGASAVRDFSEMKKEIAYQ